MMYSLRYLRYLGDFHCITLRWLVTSIYKGLRGFFMLVIKLGLFDFSTDILQPNLLIESTDQTLGKGRAYLQNRRVDPGELVVAPSIAIHRDRGTYPCPIRAAICARISPPR